MIFFFIIAESNCSKATISTLLPLFGEQIAIMASNQDSDEISIINRRKKPNLLPPQPFLNLGIYSRLFYERIRASTEI